MEPTPTIFARLGTWARNSVTLKLISIGILLLLLLIPSSMVEGLITERAANRDEATAAISAQWGGPQLLLGPVLVLPYTAQQTEDGHTTDITRYLCLLPDTLSSRGTLAPSGGTAAFTRQWCTGLSCTCRAHFKRRPWPTWA